MGTFADLEPSDPRLVGRYRIVARLGAGGMGQVYLGRSPGGRPVAVKVVRPELAGDREFRRRFARETAAARRVNGAFTAGVVDADPEGSPPWLATIFVPGLSLGEALSEHGPWPEQPTLALGAGLAEALEAIHGAGVIHRDLKPSNVLLAVDGPRVIDFGISRAAEASMDTRLTHVGTVVGTPGFMSPEQLTGDPVGPPSDVFSVGAVLVYVSTGIGPFGTGAANALNFRTVYEEPELTRVPPVLRDIVADCLAKDPGRRPDVAALLERLVGAGGADGGTAGLLTEPEWMPATVAEEVREQTSAALPRTPPPVPVPTPSPEPEPLPRPADPREPAPLPEPADAKPAAALQQAPVPAPQEPPAPTAPPTATDKPEQTAPPLPPPTSPPPVTPAVHQAPTTHPWGPPPPSQPQPQPQPQAGWPPPQPHAGWPPPVIVGPPGSHTGAAGTTGTASPSRRSLLLGLSAAAVGLGGAAFVGWKLNGQGEQGGSADPSDSPTPTDSSASTSDDPSPRDRGSGGAKLWVFDTGDLVRSSPTVVNGVVYVGSDCGCLYALDGASGDDVWSYHIGSDVRSSPTVANGVVYVGSDDGHLHAVNAATGKKAWSYDTGGYVRSSPTVANGIVYVGSDDGSLYALDAATGRKEWSYDTGDLVESSPTVVDGVVYVGSDCGCLYAFDAVTGSEKWSYHIGGESAPGSPAVAGGVVYMGAESSHLYAVDAGSGDRNWQFATDGVVATRPLVLDGVVCVGVDDAVHAVETDSGTEKWSYTLGDRVDSSPVTADGVLYIGSHDSSLYALDIGTGDRLWSYATEGPVRSTPAVADGVVYVGSDDGKVYALRA
ncbi:MULTISPECIES: PQQ-binding-like beta-propeller repeat protein [Streptomyces]|uniref:PQQ-binding-like beta-propeller repeat protein n=2 Tax=Streptomyces TaxID=1883 RepID=A0ABV9J1C3_9ACTN